MQNKARVLESFNTNAEKVTKKFYGEFKKAHGAFLSFIKGVEQRGDKEWYASLMLNRLMFIYFIQKKGFLDEDIHYLRNKLKQTQEQRGKNEFYSFYRDFLLVLFHRGLGGSERDAKLKKRLGRVPYLNGGLFDVHELERASPDIQIDDAAFEQLFDFFDKYNWHPDTRAATSGKDINPDVIGYIFEKYINDRAAMGAYYTKEDITDYISKNSVIPWLCDEVQRRYPQPFKPGGPVWKLLRENPDAYIYPAVRRGTELELPADIAAGLNDAAQRGKWNTPAPPEYGLPAEIWRETVARQRRCAEVKAKIEAGEISLINDLITYNLDIRQFA